MNRFICGRAWSAGLLLLAMLPVAHAAEPPTPAPPSTVAVVAFPPDALGGAGLVAIPPYNKAVTIAGLQKLSARELFSGAFVAFVWATEDGGSMRLVDNPFDQLAQVLAGTATLTGADGTVRQFTVGESYVVPKGYSGTWTLTPGYRHVILVETKQLQAGIGQFE
jgi:uncharacterized cupin superfamily protein